jgi:hypothetical protein
MGGPKIPMKYGRKDATSPDMCHPEGNLPAANAPFPSGSSPEGHLRAVFHRMGLTDQDIVALSGAHTVGRVHAHRSGACPMKETKYTVASACPVGTTTVGGASWTPNWVKFDNSYFKLAREHADEALVVLETDAAIFKDPEFKCVMLPRPARVRSCVALRDVCVYLHSLSPLFSHLHFRSRVSSLFLMFGRLCLQPGERAKLLPLMREFCSQHACVELRIVAAVPLRCATCVQIVRRQV